MNADEAVMIDNPALAGLQRSLSEYREAKRKIKIRLAEIEAESEMLRSQLATFDAIIEQAEIALRRVLFHESESKSAAPSRTPYVDPTLARFNTPAYHSPLVPETTVELEAEVARAQQHEKSGNVRFNDFRIPQAATIVLREADCPLHVSEIYRRMSAGGFEFRGQHQLITLAVSLNRSKRFRKVAPGTFELDPAFEASQVA